MTIHSIQSITDLTEGTILEYHAELVGGIYDTTHELRGQIIADEYPVRQVEALGNNEQLFLISKVE